MVYGTYNYAEESIACHWNPCDMCWQVISMAPAQDDTHKSVHVGLSHLAPT